MGLNNIFAGAAGTETGVNWSTTTPLNLFDYNDHFNLGTDRTGIAAGAHDNDVDPGFVNAAGGDFQTGANVDDTGFGGTLGGLGA
jgi:formylglycine-generating enzyme required for sulfatase activity